jgi:hypothetical protein
MPSWRAIFNAATILFVLCVAAWVSVTLYGVSTGALTIEKLSDRLWELVILFGGVVILALKDALPKGEAQ